MDSIKTLNNDDASSIVIVTPAASEAGEKQEQTEATTAGKSDSSDGTFFTPIMVTLPWISTDTPRQVNNNNKAVVDDEEKKVLVGSVAASKDLYAKFDKQKNRSWTDKIPGDLEEAAENEETQKYAVIVRKGKFFSTILSTSLLDA